MDRCAYLYADGYAGPQGDGRCGRYPTRGKRLCATHDPEQKATTRARHLRRRSLTPGYAESRDRLRQARSRLIAEIQALAYLWDGPGSEGRCV